MLTVVMLVIKLSHIHLSFVSICGTYHAKLSKVKSLAEAESRLSRTLYYSMDRDQFLSCDTRLCQCDDSCHFP